MIHQLQQQIDALNIIQQEAAGKDEELKQALAHEAAEKEKLKAALKEEKQFFNQLDMRKCNKCGHWTYTRKGECVNKKCPTYQKNKGKGKKGGQWGTAAWYAAHEDSGTAAAGGQNDPQNLEAAGAAGGQTVPENIGAAAAEAAGDTESHNQCGICWGDVKQRCFLPCMHGPFCLRCLKTAVLQHGNRNSDANQ